MFQHILVIEGDDESLEQVKQFVQKKGTLSCKVSLKSTQEPREATYRLPSQNSSKDLTFPSHFSLQDIEKAVIVYHLSLKASNMSLVARTLGLSRATLYRKVKEYGLNIEDYRSSSSFVKKVA